VTEAPDPEAQARQSAQKRATHLVRQQLRARRQGQQPTASSDRAQRAAKLAGIRKRRDAKKAGEQENKETAVPVTKARGVANFRLSIRAAIRGLWTGHTDPGAFFDQMMAAIRREFRIAWIEGAAECGIVEGELTDQERAALAEVTNAQFTYLPGLAEAVFAGSKANGGLLRVQLRRAEYWINQYDSVRTQAKLMACGNKKMRWDMDPSKEHCSSCAKLAGKVKRANFWQERGIMPRNAPNPNLECGGWLCGCSFVVTDETLSRGRLPNLP